MRIRSKNTGLEHSISRKDWDAMIGDRRSWNYDVVNYSELFEPHTCKSDLDYSNVRYWCQFIGSVRSGHTLVSQIINAHKDALISDELGATNLFDQNVKIDNLLSSVMVRADRYYRGGSKTWINKYDIGYFQNKTKSPIIIGDKICGSDTTKFKDRAYLSRYMGFIGFPFKFIWVLREPQQHVNGKLMLGIGANNKKYKTIESNIVQYKNQYEIAKRIEETHDVLRVYLENLIDNPYDEIIRILNFLDLSIDEEHISHCKTIIFDKPHTHEINWTDKQLSMIKDEINDYKKHKG